MKKFQLFGIHSSHIIFWKKELPLLFSQLMLKSINKVQENGEKLLKIRLNPNNGCERLNPMFSIIVHMTQFKLENISDNTQF